MTDPTGPITEDRLNRYVRRELTPAEARELAQESLDDSELFEDLTYSALAKTALTARSIPDSNIVRFPLRLALAGAAAAVVVVAIYAVRSFNQPAASPAVRPAVGFSAAPGQPILLASGLLREPPDPESPQTLRSVEPESRSPQPAGTIVSIEAGLAIITLGSLDGLAKGSELEVFRDEKAAQPLGRFIATAVFRERARGRIVGQSGIRVSHQVRVAGAVHLGALLDQVDALSSRGDSQSARTTAEKAVEWAELADVSAGEKRKALERLAALEYQAASLDAAEMHYRAATAWNNLAVLLILRGDYGGAEAALGREAATGKVANNLGVLAELRGDSRKAEKLYTEALRTIEAGERGAVEANLVRVKGLH